MAINNKAPMMKIVIFILLFQRVSMAYTYRLPTAAASCRFLFAYFLPCLLPTFPFIQLLPTFSLVPERSRRPAAYPDVNYFAARTRA